MLLVVRSASMEETVNGQSVAIEVVDEDSVVVD